MGLGNHLLIGARINVRGAVMAAPDELQHSREPPPPLAFASAAGRARVRAGEQRTIRADAITADKCAKFLARPPMRQLGDDSIRLDTIGMEEPEAAVAVTVQPAYQFQAAVGAAQVRLELQAQQRAIALHRLLRS